MRHAGGAKRHRVVLAELGGAARRSVRLSASPAPHRPTSRRPCAANSSARRARRRRRNSDRARSRGRNARAPRRSPPGSSDAPPRCRAGSSRRHRGSRSACACARSISACSQLRRDRADDACRHLVLQLEDVLERAVEAIGPEMCAGRRVDELAGDAHPVAGLAHAAFEHVAHAELAADLLHVDGAALVGEARIARDHEQPADARQAR